MLHRGTTEAGSGRYLASFQTAPGNAGSDERSGEKSRQRKANSVIPDLQEVAAAQELVR